MLNDLIEEVVPKVNIMAEPIVKNRFYIHSFLGKLKLIKSTFFLQLYTYYEVGGVFFDKDYWSFLCPENQDQIEEMVQLGKAAEWKRKFPTRKYAKLIQESGRSTYLTSAAGSYDEKLGFSMTMVNHYLNEEWYNGNFDIMENFSDNFSIDTIYSILSRSGDPICNPEKWKQWSFDFQAHFMGIGASSKG